MFCPQCSTENKAEQSYCRQCGIALTAVRLAVEGRIDEAVEKFKKSETMISWGFVLTSIGLVNAGINAFFHAWQSAVFSAAFALVIGGTLIVWGLNRLGSAGKLLNPTEKAEKKPAALDQSDNAGAALPPVPVTEELVQTPSRPPSVVENTTLKLKPSDDSHLIL